MTDDRLVMTPGPTEVPDDVREAMSRPSRNPDVDPEFAADYRRLLDKLARVYDTADEVLVLGGEGILGLETAVRSLVEPGEEVLCLANGLYGEGFADFVEMAGGDPTVHGVDWREGFDAERVAEVVADGEFVAATMVHCETPTGLLNDLDDVLAVLRDEGVLTIVDAVSSLGGTPVPVADIDVCLGASQKCFSSPPGLTTLSVSDAAWGKVESTEQDTFYTSLAPWRDAEADDLLPYTHLVSNLDALEASLDRILDEGAGAVFERHEAAAERCRERGRELGLTTYPGSESLCSPTVTAFEVDGARDVQRRMDDERDVLVATGLGDLSDDVLRVGHMGYNATVERVDEAMDALEATLDR